MKRDQAAILVRDRTAEAVADLVEIQPPAALVEAEIDGRIRDLAMRLDSQGLKLERYLEAMGRDVDSLRDDFRESAEISSRVDLGLRAVAEAEGLEADDDLLGSYLDILASQSDSDVDTVRERLRESGRLLDVRADLRKDLPAVRQVGFRVDDSLDASPLQSFFTQSGAGLATIVADPAHIVTADGSHWFPGATLPTGHHLVSVAPNAVTPK